MCSNVPLTQTIDMAICVLPTSVGMDLLFLKSVKLVEFIENQC